MPLIRCANYDDDGSPIDGGCRHGSSCQFVHPSEPARWASAPTSKLAMWKKHGRSGFRPPSKASKPRWPGSGKPSIAGPSTLAASSAEDISIDDPDSANPFDSWGNSSPGWGTTKAPVTGSASPATIGAATNVFASKGKEKASSPMQIEGSEGTPRLTSISPPPPPENLNAPPVMSPIIPQTPVQSSKFSKAGFIDRSVLDREPGEVLSSPIGAVPVNRAPMGPPKSVSLSEMHTDSERFIRQLLDAVFKTHEVKEAEIALAQRKRLVYSAKYERPSHVTRQKLESERQLAEQDRFIKVERLNSRLARLAEVPNIDAHLAELVPALEKSNTLFSSYLKSVEAWREVLEPYIRGMWEELKEKVRKREEELARDDRPDWVKNVPSMKGQYDRLVELERGVSDFILEHEDREMQSDQSLMAELLELAKEGEPRLQEAVERAKQEKADAQMKHILAERKVRDAELRSQLNGLGDVIGTELDKEAQRESSTTLEDYMASIRARVRQQHEQHAERIHAIKTQHAGVDELLKQVDSAPTHDLPRLIAETESLVKRRVDDRVDYAVGQLTKSSESILSNYETQQVRFLWESTEPLRLVTRYVDSDEGRRSQTTAALREHMKAQDPRSGVVEL